MKREEVVFGSIYLLVVAAITRLSVHHKRWMDKSQGRCHIPQRTETRRESILCELNSGPGKNLFSKKKKKEIRISDIPEYYRYIHIK